MGKLCICLHNRYLTRNGALLWCLLDSHGLRELKQHVLVVVTFSVIRIALGESRFRRGLVLKNKHYGYQQIILMSLSFTLAQKHWNLAILFRHLRHRIWQQDNISQWHHE
jgi:hypothetical protein